MIFRSFASSLTCQGQGRSKFQPQKYIGYLRIKFLSGLPACNAQAGAEIGEKECKIMELHDFLNMRV